MFRCNGIVVSSRKGAEYLCIYAQACAPSPFLDWKIPKKCDMEKGMQSKIRNIYIGVAWPYVNDLFHIGNVAGAYLPPDVFARFHKLKGNKVLMVFPIPVGAWAIN